MKKKNKKIWITPELKTITEFDVHENVVASSGSPWGTVQPDNTPPQQG